MTFATGLQLSYYVIGQYSCISDPNMFPEEPLNLSEGDGFGFFPACIWMLLSDSRYRILRKLGRGRNSTIWLVSDSRFFFHLLYYHTLLRFILLD